ncbi:MAG TPA: zf-HC2 domain-containing protein [Gemmatimonadales bacterium]|nr:zf-HC2 domain-containing protein [Gemmatimonadales bacterium]
MPHIPEDELHAYLDQALSRSQCVEIERHLAHCPACQRRRDGIVALRDRTTALLATLSPARRIPPAYEVLEARARLVRSRRTRWYRAGWAAAVVAATGLGLAGLEWQRATAPTGAEVAALSDSAVSATPAVESPAVPVPEEVALAPRRPEPQRPSARETEREAVPSSDLAVADEVPEDSPAPPAVLEPVGVTLSSGVLSPSMMHFAPTGAWRTLSWDAARQARGQPVPRIRGLPVMEVQVSASQADSGAPTMIVAQQLESGQVIRTIEGPATDVSRLLAAQRTDSGSPWPTISDDAGISGREGSMTLRRGDRILAIQAPLPVDSLRAMIRRMNAMER